MCVSCLAPPPQGGDAWTAEDNEVLTASVAAADERAGLDWEAVAANSGLERTAVRMQARLQM